MSANSELLSQCVDLAKQLMSKNHIASINILIGQDCNFEFFNQEQLSSSSYKNKSPSQIKRNLERKESYDLKNQRNDKIYDAKDNPEVSKEKTTKIVKATQTNDEKKVGLRDSEAQTIGEEPVNNKESEEKNFKTWISKK